MFSIETVWQIAWGDALVSPPIFERAQTPLSYELRPNANVTIRQFGRTIAVSTTSAGTRTVIGAPAAAPNRIHLVGDSQIFGWGLSDEETIASRLQSALGNSAVVINDGVPGYGPVQYQYLLRRLPIEDIVVVFHTEENDAADAYNFERADSVTCGYIAVVIRTENAAVCALMRLRSTQLALSYINDFLHRYAMTPLGFSEYSEVAGSVLHYRVAHLYESDQAARENRLVFSVVPWKGRYSHEWRSHYAPPPKQDVASIVSPFFDQLNMVETMRGRAGMYIDEDTHLSPAGAEVTSQSLSVALQHLMRSAAKEGHVANH